MDKRGSGIRWGVEQRLEFIEFRLYWEGRINRSDITSFFGVSVPQASKDLSAYQSHAPGNMEYDKSEKHYFASASFKPVFQDPGVDRYLEYLHIVAEDSGRTEKTWLSTPPPVESLLMPHRNIDPQGFRAVLDAVRQTGSLEVKYQSMSINRPEPIWRLITPHAFAHDGLRWHVRAYCHHQEQFRDFLLSRILETRASEERGPDADADLTWQERVAVRVTPHPDLTSAQKDTVARDYGMEDLELSMNVRLALLYYLLRRLDLDFNERNKPAREQHIVLANAEEVRIALDRAQYKQNEPPKVQIEPDLATNRIS